MANLVLFILTTIGCFCLYILYVCGTDKTWCWEKLALIVLLCVPFNIGGNVFTVLGNAEGKRVYSVFSLYQKAEVCAFAVVGVRQESKGAAIAITGITFQEAGRNAITGIGIAAYQEAGSNAINGLGVSVYQKTVGNDNVALTIIGLPLYQKASRGDAGVFIGLAPYQTAGRDATTAIGITGYQKAGRHSATAIGITVYQRAGVEARIPLALAFYQSVGGKGKVPVADRAFGVFSSLEAPRLK